jgi:hypothetical protein
MKEEKKLSLKDELQAWAGGIGIVVGLFGFSVILGMIFMDYDPMTMVEGIAEDLRTIFETIKNFFRS